MIHSSASWADGPLLAFDLETTGTDTARDRLVTATVITIVPGQTPVTRTWLADPGVDIPAEATEVHGISTEYAREHGHNIASVVTEVADALASTWCSSTPLCAFKAGFDLSLLAREMRRHHHRDLEISGPVVDPLCIDRAVDRYRKGKRTLAALCDHYRIRLDGAHTSAGDALATARLAWRLAKVFPQRIGTVPLDVLHEQQISWYKTQTESFADYLDRLAHRGHDPVETDQLRCRAKSVRAESNDWPVRAEAPDATGVMA